MSVNTAFDRLFQIVQNHPDYQEPDSQEDIFDDYLKVKQFIESNSPTQRTTSRKHWRYCDET